MDGGGQLLTLAATDIAVVGAGPAGCATAIACLQAGLRVTIVERSTGARERPGETLHPGVEVLLARLGVLDAVSAAGFPRHLGVWVGWDGGAPVWQPYGADADGPWRGFQAWRATFDALLLERARALGAAVLAPCRALAPLVAGGAVRGLRTAAGPLAARLVVDAAGAQGWLARRLGAPVVRRSPRLVTRYGWCAGERDDPLLRADERGWTWTAPVGRGLLAWTALALDGRYPSPPAAPAALAALAAHGRVRGADVSWRIVAAPAGDGYVTVGDAAALLDPSSSHGVLKALLSGFAAADLAVATLGGAGAAGASAIERYNAWARSLFEHDVARLRELYARLPAPPAWVTDT